MKKKVYISLPISGRTLDKVKERASFIKASVGEEFEPLTPFDICPDSTLEYPKLMGRDIAGLLKCQILLLDYDWQESKGCRAEHAIAQIYGLQIARIAAPQDTNEPIPDGIADWTGTVDEIIISSTHGND